MCVAVANWRKWLIIKGGVSLLLCLYTPIFVSVANPPTGSILINNGDDFTNNLDVTLSLSASDSSSSTNLLLHCDGEDGSQIFIDEIGKNVTANGNAQLDTAQAKFGPSSAYFDGAADALSVAESSEWAFEGDFTIDCWVRLSNLNVSVIDSLSNRNFSSLSTGDWVLFVDGNGYTGFYITGLGMVSNAIARVSTGTWTHLAVTRSGSTLRVFVNGIGASGTISRRLGNGKAVTISRGIGALVGDLSGWVDEVRICKGNAFWRQNFTPPDQAHSSSQGVSQMCFSNDNSNWSSPEAYATTKSWRLSSGFGTKTVYVKFKDLADNWSAVYSDTINVVNIPKERSYIDFNGKRIAMEENNKKYFFHSDHLGSTSVVTDEAGNQVKYLEYHPFGETKIEEGSLSVKKKFTGKELDDSTGLYDYGARMYESKLGRFISADTISSDLTNPQSLNRYSYTLNNPLKYIDPSGHSPLYALYLYLTTLVSLPDFQQDIQQLQVDAISGDVFGMAIDVVAAAVPGLYATAAQAGRKALSHTIDAARGAKAVNKVGDAAKAAAQLEKAKDAKTFSRFMTKAEAEAVENTKYLRGGRKGETFFTTNKYQTVKSAKSKLALETPPEVKLDFTRKNKPKVSGPTRVKAKEVGPGIVEPGGGIEFVTEDKVQVDIIRKRNLR